MPQVHIWTCSALPSAAMTVRQGLVFFFFSSRRRHTRCSRDWSSDVCSSDLDIDLQAGQPGVLQVDVGDDGSADFSFARERVATIAVDAAAGDDLVRIDESNGDRKSVV